MATAATVESTTAAVEATAATTVESATVKATATESAAGVEAAAADNNAMPRQCVRRGPLPGPSMRCCASAR